MHNSYGLTYPYVKRVSEFLKVSNNGHSPPPVATHTHMCMHTYFKSG